MGAQSPRTAAREACAWADGRSRPSARVVDARSERELARAVKTLSEKKYGWGDGLVVELTPAATRP